MGRSARAFVAPAPVAIRLTLPIAREATAERGVSNVFKR